MEYQSSPGKCKKITSTGEVRKETQDFIQNSLLIFQSLTYLKDKFDELFVSLSIAALWNTSHCNPLFSPSSLQIFASSLFSLRTLSSSTMAFKNLLIPLFKLDLMNFSFVQTHGAPTLRQNTPCIKS